MKWLNPGDKFGKLTVESFKEFRPVGKTKRLEQFYNCNCDCGKSKIIVRASLTQGLTKSCGCLLIEQNKLGKNRHKEDSASFKNFLYSYKRGAKSRNLLFELTEEDFRTITKQNCYYCEEPPRPFNYNPKGNCVPYISNGIDRLNNEIGYTITNSVPCCSVCNKMKFDLTLNQFYDKINKIFKLRIKNGI